MGHEVVAHNRRVHDLIARSYDQVHTEIVNPTEQSRIAAAIAQAVSAIRTPASGRRFLDFGAGTGNLTRHMLTYPAQVTAADISTVSLLELRRKHPGSPKLEFLELNGLDLSPMPDNSVDLLATYSVLHHVPDYLGIVREFCRVVKPGGVIYIDHECSPQVWMREQTEYERYSRELGRTNEAAMTRSLRRKAAKLFSPVAWRTLIARTFYGVNDEGDVHVTADDHVEWAEVEGVLSTACELVARHDYLLCRGSGAEAAVHRRFEGKCADMRLVIYRKRGAPA